MLSFSLEAFLIVLEHYNLAIWPLQVFAYVFGIIALLFLTMRQGYSNRIILVVLSFYWLWNGIVFCPLYWAPTYNYAYLFAVLCIIQGFLFLIGALRANISFGHHSNLQSVVGILFIAYAMLGYQLYGYTLGHVYPKFFPFGLVPCPTTVFTVGMFLMTRRRFPKYYLIAPFIIAMGGFLAVYKGILEDLGLILAGFAGTGIVLLRTERNER